MKLTKRQILDQLAEAHKGIPMKGMMYSEELKSLSKEEMINWLKNQLKTGGYIGASGWNIADKHNIQLDDLLN